MLSRVIGCYDRGAAMSRFGEEDVMAGAQEPGMEPSQEDVEAFVLAAHGDLDTVKRLHARNPALLNARWRKFDESALEAASHMGRREIAAYLLAAGAPSTICAAAMLGQTERVAALLDEDPALARATGAHRIPVLFHAALGGRTEVAELLVAMEGVRGLARPCTALCGPDTPPWSHGCSITGPA